jgi:hypothetical protein
MTEYDYKLRDGPATESSSSCPTLMELQKCPTPAAITFEMITKNIKALNSNSNTVKIVFRAAHASQLSLNMPLVPTLG